MSVTTTRRGLLRGLIAALFGWATAKAATAAASPAPPRCRHFYDGVLWSYGTAGRTGHYVRDAEQCPFCSAQELAQARPADRCTTTLAYSTFLGGTGCSARDSLSQVTTYTYDPSNSTWYSSHHKPGPPPGDLSQPSMG
jgi:hypothetical protein